MICEFSGATGSSFALFEKTIWSTVPLSWRQLVVSSKHFLEVNVAHAIVILSFGRNSFEPGVLDVSLHCKP